MARFYPNAQSGSVPQSERRVFEALKRLSDDWVVVHGLRFITPARGRRPPRNGEVDFVLIHPRYGLIVLEAKGGRYEVEHGDWYTFPGGHRERMSSSPFAQATQNRYDLADHIYQQTGVRGLRMGHAVIFTDGAPRGNLGPAAPSAIVMDGTELADLPAAVRRICAHWFPLSVSALSDAEFEQVLSVLAPTASVAADRRYTVDVTLIDVQQRTDRVIEWTSEQLEVIAATEPGAFVSVLGAAGTGKTIIAARRAAELAAAGLRVVFVADQRYLHGSLLEQPSLRHPNITVGTPGEVVRKLRPDLPPTGPDYPLWAAFVDAAEGSEERIDAVIVDEAQSYDKDLLEALLGLCPKSCQMYADPYQRDSTGMWRPPGDPRTFWLTHNCRNALPIAKLVARLSGSLSPRDGAPGSPVRFLEAERNRDAFHAQFAATVDDLIRTLSPTQVAILTCAQDTSDVRKVLGVQRVRIARRPGDDGVTLLPSREFRGCEAPAVLFVAGPEHACPDHEAATNHYIAVSRAVADLTVIGNAEDWHMYQFLMEKQ
jgi:Nuclease-related domain/AAA domain